MNDISLFMREGEGNFNDLALRIFEYQFTHCISYQRYCQKLQLTPSSITHWNEIPAVPTDVFREVDLCTFDISGSKYIFQTSGTTQEKKGKHFYRDMSFYDEAIRLSFMKGIGLQTENRICFRILTPSFHEVKTSSLFYMLQRAIEWYGDASSRFYMQNNQMDYSALFKDLEDDIRHQRPIALIGTAFSFVNLFDQYKEKKWILPYGSVLMETGGLKGRSRHITREGLYNLFYSRFSLLPDRCFSEYGMTELSSQCYSKPSSYVFQPPHWMATRIIHPETNREVSVGEEGIIQFFDLANVEGISCVMTADLARKHQDGFELLGRSPLARLRGCSTAFEAI
jgi:hypothetical protein